MVLRSVGSSGQGTVIMFIHWSGWCLSRYVCVHTGEDSEDCSLEVPHPNCDWSVGFARPDREDVMFVVAGALKPQC